MSGRYADLSEKLKSAADFVVANQIPVATRSLRSIAEEASLPPVTFTRMARALGYPDYEHLKDILRIAIAEKSSSFSKKVIDLQSNEASGFLERHIQAGVDNVAALQKEIDLDSLSALVERLSTARNVFVSGAMGSTGIAEHMAYTAGFIADNWRLVGRNGASLSSSLVGADDHDVVIVITKPPFAHASINSAMLASKQGAFVVVITDTHRCPALIYASQNFIVPTESSHFYSSYVATLAFVEAIMGELAACMGEVAHKRIQKIEEANRQMEYIAFG